MINLAGKTLTASMEENLTARDFMLLLPLTLSMDDLFGREKYATLPKALSESGPRTYSYTVGEIAYWSPSHDVAIYYRQDGDSVPPPGIIRLGQIDTRTDAFNVPGSVNLTIKLEE